MKILRNILKDCISPIYYEKCKLDKLTSFFVVSVDVKDLAPSKTISSGLMRNQSLQKQLIKYAWHANTIPHFVWINAYSITTVPID